MDSEARGKKPHVVCIPFPAQGHINPMLKLAKLLHFNGFHITFVHTEFNYNQIQTASSSSPLEGLDDFEFEIIPDSLPPSNPSTKQDVVALCTTIRTNFSAPFRRLLNRLNESAGVPSINCIISDNFMSFTQDVAAELGIPDVVFCTCGASSFMCLLHTRKLIERGVLPLKIRKLLKLCFKFT
ncbi:uncharacterized protein A4U43_C03F2760 [Asparagus officinalis]|uniref:Glycosyltransferase N-terminal domain-containing protein n=1 Tax=Asparagus officinalis TaxID=4686 RepID=A0A5P1FBA1_ASPOF|nr:uncharacterized protein A4U43_C03F2760 [Asparagus officinalis]